MYPSFKTFILAVIVLVNYQSLLAQSVQIKGQIESEQESENIHVINSTSQVFTISDKYGRFTILAKLKDTLVFSSVQHKKKEVIVNELILNSKTLIVKLEEQINTLDEVRLGKVLTGDLLSDINNSETDVPINFYDLGIPGYTGKVATQSERRLAEAGDFKPQMLLGLLGGGLPLNPIINGLSGRTKMLKNRVKLESNEQLMQTIKIRYFSDFFTFNELDETFRMDFFYFCLEDETFTNRCKDKTNVEVLEFLSEKLTAYKANLRLNEED